MPLIEDLSRYGIEDCSYSPEAQKSNAYNEETGFEGTVLEAPRARDLNREPVDSEPEKLYVREPDWRHLQVRTCDTAIPESLKVEWQCIVLPHHRPWVLLTGWDRSTLPFIPATLGR
ncbi:hypothetical protein TNCV_3549171 [Trichonephila clavipes]|nr:hypothetical protein TNCV_3549171 [Trichonephila clavipes]